MDKNGGNGSNGGTGKTVITTILASALTFAATLMLIYFTWVKDAATNQDLASFRTEVYGIRAELKQDVGVVDSETAALANEQDAANLKLERISAQLENIAAGLARVEKHLNGDGG